VGFKAPTGACQQRESLADISFPLWSFQISSQQWEAGGGNRYTPEVCALGRTLTLAVTHTLAEAIQKSQDKTRSYTFSVNSWGVL